MKAKDEHRSVPGVFESQPEPRVPGEEWER